MKHWLIILLLLLLSYTGNAQPVLPKLSTYADRYYYTESIKPALDKMPKEKVADTLNALIDAADKADDESLVYQLRLLKCETEMYAHIVSPKDIEEDIESIIAYASDEQNQYMEAEALQLAGDYYIEYHKQSASLENYVAAYRIYQKFTPNDFPPKQDYVYTLGSAYYRLDDYENAIRYLQEALLIKNTGGKKLFYTINNTIGLSFRNMGQYDSAIWYFKRIYDSVSKEPSLNTWQHISEGNIGITFFLQKKYADATPLLEHDIETSIAHNQVKNAVKSMTIRAAIYYYYNDYSSAKDLLLKALTMARNKGFWDDYQLPEEIYGWLAKVYAAQKDMTQAYLYADSALVAKDSLMTENSSLNLAKANEKISYVQKKLDEERYNERLKLDQLALSKKRIEATFFFIGIVVLLLVVIFIARERKRSENILLNILPEQIAERLKKREHPIADYFDNASILFIDMAGFTSFSGTRDPKEVVTMLNKIFTNFDMLADKHGLEKIKTIGDCYMAVSGLPEPNPHHAEAAAAMAMEIKSEMGKYKASDGTPIQFRMGLDCGPVVAGVIGQRKFIYDLWGDTVNTASRMETTGIAGEIHCSDRFKKQLEGKYTFKSRGTIEIKGKGMMETWLMV